MPPNPGLEDLDALVGEGSLCLCSIEATRPRGVQVSVSVVGVELFASREGVVAIVLVGEGVGVDCRNGEGECGDSGRRNGDARGEP